MAKIEDCPGFETFGADVKAARKAKLHNLKQAARTLNFLTEHEIESYPDLKSRVAEIIAANTEAVAALKAEYKQLTEQKDQLQRQYAEAKRQMQEYGIIKQNVDGILRTAPGKEQMQER